MKRRRFFGALVGLACAPVAAAAAPRQVGNVTTLAAECAKQGQYWREVIEQRKRELLVWDSINTPAEAR